MFGMSARRLTESLTGSFRRRIGAWPERLPSMERMSTDTQMRPLLTIPEVAARLNVSESTVRRRIEEGDLPALRLGRGPQPPVRIDPTALEAWLLASLLEPPAGEAALGVASSRFRGPEGEAS